MHYTTVMQYACDLDHEPTIRYDGYMHKNRLVLLVVGVLILGGLVFWQLQTKKGDDLTMPAVSDLNPTSIPEEKNVTVEEASVTFTIPVAYNFEKELQMNLTTNKPFAVNFTVQNYVGNPTTVSNPYQLYGHYQWDNDPMTRAQFDAADFMLDPKTREEFIVDGRPAVKGVSGEERSRYTVYILNNERLFVLAADGTDEEHQKITDEIVKSIKFMN